MTASSQKDANERPARKTLPSVLPGSVDVCLAVCLAVCIYAPAEEFLLHAGVQRERDCSPQMLCVRVAERLTAAGRPGAGWFITQPLLCSV